MAIRRNKTIENTVLFVIIAGFCVTTFATSKDIITGDIRPSNAKSTVIAKAPEDAAFKSLDTDQNGKISLQESIKDSNLALHRC
jgi:hypothetical protein